MNIPTTIFYKPLINQSLFQTVIDAWPQEQKLEAQKQVLALLDTTVIPLVCDQLTEHELRQQFLQQCQLPELQNDLLDSLLDTHASMISLLEERIERTLLELYSYIMDTQKHDHY